MRNINIRNTDYSNIFFTADLHIGHKYAIEKMFGSGYCLEDYRNFIIENWNHKVDNKSIVVIVGDMFHKCDTRIIESTLRKLNGIKILIKGNHDNNVLKYSDMFMCVEDSMQIKITYKSDPSVIIHLNHYPILEWQGYFKPSPSYMIHGHVHSQARGLVLDYMVSEPRILNAFIGINNYVPVTLKELIINNNKFKESKINDKCDS